MASERLSHLRQQILAWRQRIISQARPHRRCREVRCIFVWTLIVMVILSVAWAVDTDIEDQPAPLEANTLWYALSTIAQCAAALAALIGFLGLWRLDRLREERTQAEHYLRWMMYRERLNMDPQNAQEVMILSTDRLIAEAGSLLAANAREESDARLRELLEKFHLSIDIQVYKRWHALPDEQRRLMRVLRIFLVVTLGILVLAIIGIPFVTTLSTWPWTFRILIILASLGLGVGPFYVVREAVRAARALLVLTLLLALVSPTLAGSVRCTTYEVKSLGRLQTLCDDGTRAVHTYNKTLARWESTVTPPPSAAQPQIRPQSKAPRR